MPSLSDVFSCWVTHQIRYLLTLWPCYVNNKWTCNFLSCIVSATHLHDVTQADLLGLRNLDFFVLLKYFSLNCFIGCYLHLNTWTVNKSAIHKLVDCINSLTIPVSINKPINVILLFLYLKMQQGNFYIKNWQAC